MTIILNLIIQNFTRLLFLFLFSIIFNLVNLVDNHFIVNYLHLR